METLSGRYSPWPGAPQSISQWHWFYPVWFQVCPVQKAQLTGKWLNRGFHLLPPQIIQGRQTNTSSHPLPLLLSFPGPCSLSMSSSAWPPPQSGNAGIKISHSYILAQGNIHKLRKRQQTVSSPSAFPCLCTPVTCVHRFQQAAGKGKRCLVPKHSYLGRCPFWAGKFTFTLQDLDLMGSVLQNKKRL